MNSRVLRTNGRQVVIAAAIALLLSLGLGVYVFAGHVTGPVSSFTGCLSPPAQGGVVYLLNPGNVPAGPCRPGHAQIHLSGGDITAVNTPAAGGLEGGAVSGDSSLALRGSFKLPQACGAGQVAKWNGTLWACANDESGAGGGGDITAVNTGDGLTGGGTSGDVALAVSFSGTGTATAAARGDHDHDARYFTRPEADDRFTRVTDSAKTLWALVRHDGTLLQGFGATGAVYLGPGTYAVTFDRDIAPCGLQATIDSYSPGLSGEITVQSPFFFGGGFSVAVLTQGPAGKADLSFHLAVHCP